jgi:hypothetical protein
MVAWEPVPPPLSPDPAKVRPGCDPEVRTGVAAEYEEGLRSIERKVKGMGLDRARKFRRTAPDALESQIAEKYGLTVDPVKRMVGR